VKGAFLHVLGDTISSVGVIIGGVFVYLKGLYIVDPIIGMLIGAVILKGAIGLIWESAGILLESVPRHIKIKEVVEKIRSIKGVSGVHDIHVWTIGTGHHALSAHVVVEDQMVSKCSEILEEVRAMLEHDFGITHSTIQLECKTCEGNVCGAVAHTEHKRGK
ncbi:MAG: cation diffusion facilitator family transporter, partial [Candidatus Thermoplasmatota archaeon]|nr:cation diffusion facilitator family transporter [Candidatus Thermoplasmatota archaeon]